MRLAPSRPTLALPLALAALAAVGPAQARKVKQEQKKVSEQALRGIEEAMGEFAWGMKVEDVKDKILGRMRADYEERIRASRDQNEQQKLRDELQEKIKEVEGSYVEFTGQRGGWDSSVIEQELVHGNREAMLFRWEPDQRRFFFFHEGTLYKMVLVLSGELLRDKNFDQFIAMLQGRYGPAAEGADEPGTIRVAWGPAGVTLLEALDQSEFFGSFSLRLTDVREGARVAEGRKVAAPEQRGTDPLVDAALKDSGVQGDANEDILDQITGVKAAVPVTSAEGTPPPTRGRKGKDKAPAAAPASAPGDGGKKKKGALDGAQL